MTPEQFTQILQAISEHSTNFSWMQGIVALGATLVSVTGVVVGMKAAINTLAEQLKETRAETRASHAELSDAVNHMAQEIAVLKYATGVEASMPPRQS